MKLIASDSIKAVYNNKDSYRKIIITDMNTLKILSFQIIIGFLILTPCKKNNNGNFQQQHELEGSWSLIRYECYDWPTET